MNKLNNIDINFDNEKVILNSVEIESRKKTLSYKT